MGKVAFRIAFSVAVLVIVTLVSLGMIEVVKSTTPRAVLAQQQSITLPTPVHWTDGKASCYLSFSGGLSCFQVAAFVPPTPTPTRVPPTPTPLPPTPTQVTPTPTQAAPSASLKNPDFEAGMEHWTPFTLYSQTPLEFNVESLARGASQWVVRAGDKSLRIKGMYQCWDAGYYQVVPMSPGTRFRFSVYAMTWGRNSSDINLPTDPNLMSFIFAGVDPYGFTQAGNTRVQWSSVPGTDSLLDFPGVGEYAKPVVVDGIAVADRVTVFIRANLGGVPQCVWPYESMLAFFDEARLVIIP